MNVKNNPLEKPELNDDLSVPRIKTHLAIIIVSYNTRKLIRRCLQSIQSFSNSVDREVFVIDNNSQDDSVTMLQKEFPWVHVIANQHNLGYSAAVNQGLDAAESDYALVLNPDIIVKEESIAVLLRFMDEHSDVGLCAAKLQNTDGSLQHSCRSFYTPKTLIFRRTVLGKIFPNHPVVRKHLMLDYDHQAAREVDWVIGACMMVRRQAVEAVGGMDERFFLYFEDVDWCYRMSRQGWKVYYVPESEMYHEHRRDSARPRLTRSFWAHLGSLLRFYEKWNRYAYVAKRYREVAKLLVFVLSDFAAVNLSFRLAYEVRILVHQKILYNPFSHNPIFHNPIFPLEGYHNFWVFINIVVLLALFFSGQYRVQRGKHLVDEFLDIVKGLSVALLIIMASTYIAHERLISRAVVVFFFIFGMISILGLRRLWRFIHTKILEMRLDLRRLVILGTESEVRELRSRLVSRTELGLDVVGAIDADPIRTARSLGTVDDLEEVVAEQRIQEVVVAPSAADAEQVGNIVLRLRHRSVDVKVISGFAEILSHRAKVERLADIPILRFERDTLYALFSKGKRLLDILVSLIMMLLGMPLSVLYWLVAKIRGRELFTYERRLGHRARPFDFPVVNANLGLPPSDFINLPAWYAVLRGKMSIVGPYAMPPEMASQLKDWQRVNLDVRPGIVGYWRLLDSEDFDMDSVLRLDLYYVQNWSVGLDFRLLLMSFSRMLRGRSPRLRSKASV